MTAILFPCISKWHRDLTPHLFHANFFPNCPQTSHVQTRLTHTNDTTAHSQTTPKNCTQLTIHTVKKQDVYQWAYHVSCRLPMWLVLLGQKHQQNFSCTWVNTKVPLGPNDHNYLVTAHYSNVSRDTCSFFGGVGGLWHWRGFSSTAGRRPWPVPEKKRRISDR